MFDKEECNFSFVYNVFEPIACIGLIENWMKIG